MPARTCRVTIRDLEGIDHTVSVTASTLYEAVALGIAALQGQEWVAGIAQGLNVVKVSVASTPVEHAVQMGEFQKWLSRSGGSPRDVSQRARIREILGLP